MRMTVPQYKNIDKTTYSIYYYFT